MRTFIISDLHGNGDIYNSIMNYLENISNYNQVELYINGDLIDRGINSYDMLEDVINRIKNDDFIKIHYLGGNHELMMYNALCKKIKGKKLSIFNDWLMNGGFVIDDKLNDLDNSLDKCKEFFGFIGNLDIYHKFEETINGNNILLVHAKAPNEVLDKCNMKISDNNKKVSDAVWTRDKKGSLSCIGKEGYLTIIGHTPIYDRCGFMYNEEGNYINIDGACAAYACGYFEHDHVPLVEVCDNYLELLIWNHKNSIIDGYYFDGDFYKMTIAELVERREYINYNNDKKYIKNER